MSSKSKLHLCQTFWKFQLFSVVLVIILQQFFLLYNKPTCQPKLMKNIVHSLYLYLPILSNYAIVCICLSWFKDENCITLEQVCKSLIGQNTKACNILSCDSWQSNLFFWHQPLTPAVYLMFMVLSVLNFPLFTAHFSLSWKEKFCVLK